MSENYTPKASEEHKGFYEIPGFSSCCASRKGKILIKSTGHITEGGNAGRYLKVHVLRDGHKEGSLYYVHDLICRAFYGAPKSGQVVLHKNNERWDNLASNLKWGTQSENIKDMYKDGLKVSKEEHVWMKW